MRDDLAAFWQQTRSLLDRVPADPVLTSVAAPDWADGAFTIQAVTLHSFEAVRIRGLYLLPTERPGRRLPAVMIAPGYSGIRMNPGAAHVAMNGYATLVLYPRGQGESRAEWDVPPGATKLTCGLPRREDYYYRAAYMDCVRGVDFLATRPEVDAQRIGMWAASQGGGLTLATAALDQRLRAAVADLPFLCNMPAALDVPDSPFREVRDYLQAHPDRREQVMQTLAAFDCLSLADAIACPTLISIGARDAVCPPMTIEPVFARIRAIKSLIVYPELGHGMYVDFYTHAFAWLRHYLSD